MKLGIANFGRGADEGVSAGKIIVKRLSLGSWIIWGLISLQLLSESDSDLLAAYLGYWFVSGLVLLVTREDVLAPSSICVLISFLSFGFNIPFIGAGLVDGISIKDEILAEVAVIVTFAVVAFAVGALSWPKLLVPRLFHRKRVGVGPPKASFGLYILLLGFAATAAFIRMRFHLGEAGVQPALPFAGVIQFFLYEGVVLLSLWFLSSALRQGGVLIVCGLSLLLILAVTQALLGWRGAIFHMILMGFGIFWYQLPASGRKRTSPVWLILLVLLAGSVLQLGNAVRAERLGGEVEFAETGGDFITKLMTRSQGTTRLARIVDHFDGISYDNDGLLFTLLDKGISTTQYIDHKLYRVEGFQSHSVGTSGPGGPFTALGLLGVVGAYFLLGIVYRITYLNLIKYGRQSPISIALYIYMAFILILSMSENLSLLTVKMLFAVYMQAYFFDRFIVSSKAAGYEIVKNHSQNMDREYIFNIK